MSFVTKVLNPKAAWRNAAWRKTKTRLAPTQMAARTPFAFTYAGWTITTPPPAVPGMRKFAPSPTAPMRIRSADGAWLPSQTVTPTHPVSQHVRAHVDASDDAEFWLLTAPDGSSVPLRFTLDLSALPAASKCDVAMTLNLAACAPAPPMFSITVNGRALKIYYPTEASWAAQHVFIPADFLQRGANQIVVTPLGRYYGIWLQSVQFASRSVPISIGVQWLQICAGELDRGEAIDQSVRLTHGTPMTDSQIRAFAKQFDIDVEGSGIESLLAALSTHLAARFSFDERTGGSVPIERDTTAIYALKIARRARDDEPLTFQVWQLALVYEANGCQLVHALGPHGPIVFQQFPPRV
ncbi:hypothetical protein [Roseiterribacter gracilis]